MLGKLKNYCGCCRKQCKDENGYKVHVSSSHHQKMASSRNENHTSSASFAFEQEFSDLFRIKYGYNKYIPVNKIYNEMVHDRHHTHMSTTRFNSLNGFATYLHYSSEEGPNRLGFEWKLQKMVGEVEDNDQVCIMLLDTKAEKERIRKENEITPREFDRKRDEKMLEK